MKLLTSLSLISLTILSASAQESILDTAISKVSDGEIKYGLEALTTWRSEYNHRGFTLASNSMEFQLAGQVALSNNENLDFGLYYGTATSDGDFAETGAFIDFSKNIGDLTYTAKLTLKDYTHSSFKSGADIGGSVNWVMNDTFDFTALLSYDTGAKGAYGEIKASAYKEISQSSYLLFDTGIGVTANYYGRNGLHQIFAKLEYTYNISDNVSVSPFLGASIGIHDEADNSILSGVYFAVSF